MDGEEQGEGQEANMYTHYNGTHNNEYTTLAVHDYTTLSPPLQKFALELESKESIGSLAGRLYIITL